MTHDSMQSNQVNKSMEDSGIAQMRKSLPCKHGGGAEFEPKNLYKRELGVVVVCM